MKRLLVVAIAACHDPVATPVDAPHADAPAPAHWVAYVGGYGGAITWYSVDVESGALARLGEIAASDPSFLAFDAGFAHAYAVDESGNRVVAFAIDPATGALTRQGDQSSGGSGPAHVAIADGHVLVANYGDGTVSVLPIAGDGSVMPAAQTLGAGAHAHQVLVSGGHAFVPCLGSDAVVQYGWAQGALAANGQMMTAAGAGPRHLALAPDGLHAYLIDETDSTVMVLAIDAQGRLSPVQTLSSLRSGFTGSNTGAEIAVRGDHVYVSNRGADDLAVFGRDAASGQLTAITHVASGGATPRHFSLSPDGRLLFVANQGSNTVVPFAIDSSGVPAPVAAPVAVQAPTFVGIAALP